MMTDFHNVAAYNFSEIEEARTEMKQKVGHYVYLSVCKSVRDGQRFITVMTDFHNVAAYNFSEIEEARTEMKQKVSQSVYLLVCL